MGEYVLFQMWGPFREHLIASHEFYVSEARDRLLAQFTEETMEADADRFAETWLAKMAGRFDPERDDPGAYYEEAHDESISFYQRLAALRDTTRLSVIAGMYHEWEKQLRDWVARELRRVVDGPHLRGAIWQQKIDDLFDFLESWGWPVKSRPYYADLRTCHLVVNVYKHGSGKSLDELKRLAPDLAGRKPWTPDILVPVLDHTNLSVGDAELDRFASAITEFWRDVPENTFQSQIANEPAWVAKALGKDVAAQK